MNKEGIYSLSDAREKDGCIVFAVSGTEIEKVSSGSPLSRGFIQILRKSLFS